MKLSNVRIVNETGLVRDTKVFVGDTQIKCVLSISVCPIESPGDNMLTATITTIAELDIVAEVNKNGGGE